MYTLKVKSGFSAAHRLPEYNGPCRRPHGHNFLVTAVYQKENLDSQGLALDLRLLRSRLRAELAKYDHQSLNSVLPMVPTSENLARVIYTNLKKVEAGEFLWLVEVEETEGTAVNFQETR